MAKKNKSVKRTELDRFWRSLVTDRMGGAEFDAPGGGYTFSAVTAEEKFLAKKNAAGKPKSALLCLSIADPTWKLPEGAWKAGEAYYREHPHSTRYTDLFGVQLCEKAGININTHEQIAAYLNKEHGGSGTNVTSLWVQYLPGSIKRASAEYISTVLFDENAVLVFPTPGYGVIKDPKNNRGAKIVDVPLVYDEVKKTWDFDFQMIIRHFDCFACNRKRYMYVNVPHNPTGMAYGRRQWKRIIAWALKNNIVLIVDEAYTHIRFRHGTCSVLDVLGWEKCCVVFQSVSKGWNATGMRFGYVIAHPTMILAMRSAMDVKDSGSFGPDIAAGLWCLKHPEYATGTAAAYENLLVALANGLRDAKFDVSMPDAGLCLFTPAPKSINGQPMENSAQCAKWLREKLRISLMHYTVKRNDNGQEVNTSWLRWAVTIKLVPECGLYNEAMVIAETVRRLKSVKFKF